MDEKEKPAITIVVRDRDLFKAVAIYVFVSSFFFENFFSLVKKMISYYFP